jgi:hypothetical protein
MSGVKALTTHEAQVTTASVEVKTLTIRDRQVTLAVFRQLHREAVIDGRSGEISGVPWGTINYFWKGCGLDEEHVHVVWQKGDELRRDCVRSPDWYLPYLRVRTGMMGGLATLLLVRRLLRLDEEAMRDIKSYHGDGVLYMSQSATSHGVPYLISPPSCAMDFVDSGACAVLREARDDEKIVLGRLEDAKMARHAKPRCAASVGRDVDAATWAGRSRAGDGRWDRGADRGICPRVSLLHGQLRSVLQDHRRASTNCSSLSRRECDPMTVDEREGGADSRA